VIRVLLLLCFAAPALSAPDPGEALLRDLKRAERAGFERHDLKAFMAMMTDDVSWVRGRREVADEHDVKLDAKMLRELMALRWKRPPTGRPRMYFHDEEVEVDGAKAVVQVDVTRQFFGGSDAGKRRYELERMGKGKAARWKVRRVREWLLRSSVGGDPEDLSTDTFWIDVDERVDEMRKEPGTVSLAGRLAVLVKARRLPEAYAEAVAETEKSPRSTEAWLARAALALEVGRVADARAAAATARKIERTVDIPALLRD
jgi:hypothetical protein